MKRIPLALIAIAATSWVGAVVAETPEREAAAAMAQESQRMLEEAERARTEAETARREAERVAERARETARLRAEQMREAAEQAALSAEERAREQALRDEEMARARDELSRAHRELREASREIARAHRELARADREQTVRFLNLGDRAVIGVVLGSSGPDGVELIGVSPGGPAEKAGIRVGDRMVEIAGQDLRDASAHGRGKLFEVMEAAKPGDELEIVVERDGQPLQFTVEAEQREPTAWQSIIRIPEIAGIEGIETLPGEAEIRVERIRVPEIDREGLQQKMQELRERLETQEFIFVDPETGEQAWHGDFNFDVDVSDFSSYADRAFAEADVFFGLSTTRGLEFATINAGLGAYFGTDRGVLVLRAEPDNAYGLRSGDVILAVDGDTVDSPAELLRALRHAEPGQDVALEIRRERQAQTLEVTMPENRLGLR